MATTKLSNGVILAAATPQESSFTPIITNPQNGDFLRYSTAQAGWVNRKFEPDVWQVMADTLSGDGVTIEVIHDEQQTLSTIQSIPTGVTPGTYNNVTIDIYGRVIAANNLGSSQYVLKTGDTMTGNLNFDGSNLKFTADFSNPLTSFVFQSNVVDGKTETTILPNGSSTSSEYTSLNSNDRLNSSFLKFGINGDVAGIHSGQTSVGATTLPIQFIIDAPNPTAMMTINIDGSVVLNESPPASDNSNKVATTEWVKSEIGISIPPAALPGFMIKTGTATDKTVSLIAGSGINITNTNGVVGNPAISLINIFPTSGGAFQKFTSDTYGRVTAYSPVTSSDITTLLGSTGVPAADIANNVRGGGSGAILWQIAQDDTGFTGVGTVGQVLSSNGPTVPTWINQTTINAGSAIVSATSTIVDDTTTATPIYPTMVATNTGNNPLKVTSTKLSFVPSTGVLSAPQFSGSGAGLTNIPNSSFSNSSLTVAAGPGLTGGGLVQLGGTVTLSLPTTGITVGTYTQVTVDDKGRVTAGNNPTTLAGYGITNALSTSTAFSGDVTGLYNALTLVASGVTANTYNNSTTAITPFTVDAKGRITGTSAAQTITPAWTSVTGKPTTTAGFGITDGLTTSTTFGGDVAGTYTSLVLPNISTPGTYNNSATALTPFSIDNKGRITSTLAAVTITPAWDSVTGKPAAFTPAAHTHPISEVIGLQGALDGKLNLTGGTMSGAFYTAEYGGGTMSQAISTSNIEIGSNSTSCATITFHRHGAFAANLGIDTDNQLKFGGWSLGANAYVIWNASNFNPNTKQDALGYTPVNKAGDTMTGALTVNAALTGSEVYSNGWFRSTGGQGWFNSTYNTGIFSTQAGWVDTYNNSNLRITGDTIRIANGGAATASVIADLNANGGQRLYFDNSPSCGFLNNGGAWAFRVDNAGSIYSTADVVAGNNIRGLSNITIGSGQNAELSMTMVNSNTHGYFFLSTNGQTGYYDATRAKVRYASDVAGNFTVNGDMTVGVNLTLNGDSCYIRLNDTNWGLRYVHSNDGNIGFLNNSGGWSMYNDNAGNVWAPGNITAGSDIRHKTDIKPLQNVWNKLLEIDGFTYKRTNVETTDRNIGVSAQATQLQFPEAVMEDKEGILSIAYGQVAFAALVEFAKEAKERIDRLESQIRALQGR